MDCQLVYAIKFVSDMARSVGFYRDTLGLTLKFESPEWSEFSTGTVTLALHRASDENPAGMIRLGFQTSDIESTTQDLTRQGVQIVRPPREEFGVMLAEFLDLEGSRCSLSGPVPGGS